MTEAQRRADEINAQYGLTGDDKVLPELVPVEDKPWTDDLAEIGKQVVGGAVVDLPEMLGKATTAFSSEGSFADRMGKKLIAGAKGREDYWKPNMEGRGKIAEALISGGRAVAPSVATMGVGLGAGVLGAGALTATALGMGASGALFGGSQYQDTYDKLTAAGVSPEEAHTAALKAGAVQGGGEALANIAQMKLLGKGAQLVRGGIEGSIKNAVKQEPLKDFAKAYGTAMVVEPATEIAQDIGTEAVERGAGVKTQDYGDIAYQSGTTAMGMTTLLAPFGLRGHFQNEAKAKITENALDNPKIAKEYRQNEVNKLRDIAKGQGVDKVEADDWHTQATAEIAAGKPVTRTAPPRVVPPTADAEVAPPPTVTNDPSITEVEQPTVTNDPSITEVEQPTVTNAPSTTEVEQPTVTNEPSTTEVEQPTVVKDINGNEVHPDVKSEIDTAADNGGLASSIVQATLTEVDQTADIPAQLEAKKQELASLVPPKPTKKVVVLKNGETKSAYEINLERHNTKVQALDDEISALEQSLNAQPEEIPLADAVVPEADAVTPEQGAPVSEQVAPEVAPVADALAPEAETVAPEADAVTPEPVADLTAAHEAAASVVPPSAYREDIKKFLQENITPETAFDADGNIVGKPPLTIGQRRHAQQYHAALVREVEKPQHLSNAIDVVDRVRSGALDREAPEVKQAAQKLGIDTSQLNAEQAIKAIDEATVVERFKALKRVAESAPVEDVENARPLENKDMNFKPERNTQAFEVTPLPMEGAVRAGGFGQTADGHVIMYTGHPFTSANIAQAAIKANSDMSEVTHEVVPFGIGFAVKQKATQKGIPFNRTDFTNQSLATQYSFLNLDYGTEAFVNFKKQLQAKYKRDKSDRVVDDSRALTSALSGQHTKGSALDKAAIAVISEIRKQGYEVKRIGGIHKASVITSDSIFDAAERNAKNTATPVAEPLPAILTQSKIKWVAEQVKAKGLKKGSPGYDAQVSQIGARYESEIDDAFAAAPFEVYASHPLNKGVPPSVLRAGYEALQPQFRFSPKTEAKISPEEATNHLIDNFGMGVKRLLNTGKLILTTDPNWYAAIYNAQIAQGLTPNVSIEKGSAAHGAVYDGKIYINLLTTNKDKLVPTLIHELGEHIGLKGFLGEKEYQGLQDQITRLSQIKGNPVQASWNYVAGTYKHLEVGSEMFISEVIARIGETHPDIAWYRRLLAKVKSYLVARGLGKGFLAGTMTADDLNELLKASARAAMTDKGYAKVYGAEPSFSQSDARLAPNGKPSNLNDKQYEQVRTPEFKKWFGDWENDPENASKVVDENGEPLVVSHSTDAEFSVFNQTQKNDSGWLGKGAYFFGDRSLDGQYGKNVVEVFLNIKEPYYAADEDMESLSEANDDATSAQFTTEKQAEGYDGVYYNGNLNHEWVAYEPNQIKSALGNNGEFSASNDDIRFMFAGEKAQTASIETLAQAKERIANGEDKETVRKETGWHQGADKMWRFEIVDRYVKLDTGTFNRLLNGATAPLQAVLNAKELFDAYPQIKEFSVKFGEAAGASSTNIKARLIKISKYKTDGDDFVSSLLHEIQHLVQVVEGFAQGTTLAKAGSREAYRENAGEVEARNMQARQKFTTEQRRERSPESTQDTEPRFMFQDDMFAPETPNLDLSLAARMRRAKELGFDTAKRYYHGTTKSFEAFDLSKTDERPWHPEGMQYVVLSSNPTTASSYAGETTSDYTGKSTDYSEGGQVMPLVIRKGKTLTVNAKGAAWNDIWYQDDTWSTDDLAALAKEKGYDTLIVKNVNDNKTWSPEKRLGDTVIVFDPTNIRSVNARFDPAQRQSADVMFSLPDTERDEILDAPPVGEDNSKREKVQDFFENKISAATTAMRETRTGAATVKQLGELVKHYSPEISTFIESNSQHLALKSRVLSQAARQVTNKWQALNKADARLVNNLVRDSDRVSVHAGRDFFSFTMPYRKFLVDDIAVAYEDQAGFIVGTQVKIPAENLIGTPFESLLSPDPGMFVVESEDKAKALQSVLEALARKVPVDNIEMERRARWKANSDRFKTLSQEQKDVYTDADAFMRALYDKATAGMVARFRASLIRNSDAEAAIAAYILQRNASKVMGYYSPAMRAGKFYFYGVQEDGTHLFSMFRTEKALYDFASTFKGERVSSGDMLSKGGRDYMTTLGADDSFMKQMQDAIFEGVSDPTEREALRDEVFTQYLKMLPEVSMRKHNIHRKQTAGAEDNAKAAFANYARHGASQLAGITYNDKLRNALKAAERVVGIFQSGVVIEDGKRVVAKDSVRYKVELELAAAKALLPKLNGDLDALYNQLSADESETGVVMFDMFRSLFSGTQAQIVSRLKKIPGTEALVKDIVENPMSTNARLAILTGDRLTIFRQVAADVFDINSAPENVRTRTTAEIKASVQAIHDSADRAIKTANHIEKLEVQKTFINVLEELKLSYQAIANSQGGKLDDLVQVLNQATFFMMIGFGTSTALINTLQVGMVAVPIMAGRYKSTDVASVLAKNYKMFFDAMGTRDEDGEVSMTTTLKKLIADPTTPDREILSDLLNAMTRAKAENDISLSLSHDAARISDPEYKDTFLTNIATWSGWMMHHAERLNREVTFATAFLLARDPKYKPVYEQQKASTYADIAKHATLEAQTANNAFEYARYVNYAAHGDYSMENAARFFRGNIGRTATQFMKYEQQAYWNYGRMAYVAIKGVESPKNVLTNDKGWPKHVFEFAQQRNNAAIEANDIIAQQEAWRTLSSMAAAQVMAAGTMSLPLIGVTMGMLSIVGAAVGGDEPWDTEKELQMWLVNLLGKEAAEMFMNGTVNALTPVNLASRMDLSNIAFREPLVEKESQDEANYYLARIWGPTGAIATNFVSAWDLAKKGEKERALEKVMPKAVTDMLKAARYVEEGGYRNKRGELVKKMSATEIGLQALGFTSSEINRTMTEMHYIKGEEHDLTEARSKIVGELAEATIAGEPLDYTAVREWNGRHPEFIIKPENVKQSVQSRKTQEKNRDGTSYTVNPKLAHLREKYDLTY